MDERGHETQIAVMITTFRRPAGLLRTLQSVAEQKVRRGCLSIYVIDNDCDKTIEKMVLRFADSARIPISYHPEICRGVASARNRALSLMRSDIDYVAFIDDDEIASPHWLDCLVATARRFQADIVQGPVEPVYEGPCPDWFENGRFTALGPFREGEELRYGFSGNVLLSAPMVRATGTRFDPSFDRSGGEDQHFFMMLMAQGHRILTSRDAIVFETIPSSRTTLRDYLKRRFRIGATLTVAWRLLRNYPSSLLMRISVGVGHVVFGGLSFLAPWSWSRHQLAIHAGRMAYGLGQVAGAAGWVGAAYETIHQSPHDRHEEV